MKSLVLLVSMLLVGCGYESVDNDIIGQPKKVLNQTPLVCPNRVDVDVSLGVIRDGVGSMSAQDVWLTVPNRQDRDTLNQAARDGKIVKVRYNTYRLTVCQPDKEVISVEVL